MKQFKHWKNTLLAMAIAWVLGTTTMLIIAGVPSPGQAFEIFLMTGLFAFMAWGLFILPFAGKIHRFFIQKHQRQWLLPILSTLYGYLAFVVLFSALTGSYEFLIYPTTIGGYALGFGLIWGVAYLLIEKRFTASN